MADNLKFERVKNSRLGDLLVDMAVITESQLEQALKVQKQYKTHLGQCLVSLGFATDNDIASALEKQLKIPKVNLRGIKIDTDLINMVNGTLLRKNAVLPIGYTDEYKNTIILAMANPLDFKAQEDISIITNCMIERRITTVGEINLVLDKYFGNDEAMSAVEQYAKERNIQLQQVEVLETDNQSELDNAPIVQLVRSIIEQAARQRASDIHIDALEKNVRIRYRIDGVLQEKMLYDIKLLPAITARVKILSDMDISEKRKPQDGRMTIMVDKTEYDIRVSILPSAYGEKIVMRLATKKNFVQSKTNLGMNEHDLKLLDKILLNPNGIILVTGPTGSGKSTTLYTVLSELNDERVNIITVEDPVEANVAGVNQVQVNVKADLTFVTALRSILRQDPDIIMIGEIRDYETASIAVQASITGHLVVSTLHTNSSSATITRLLDMGVESFLLADSVVGIIAQRLVRRLCPSCKKKRLATDMEKEILRISPEKDVEVYDSVGCPQCNETGFYGRIGVYEIMEMTQGLKRIITQKGSTAEIKKSAVDNGMRTLFTSARRLVLDGTTTVDEVIKITAED